MISRIGKARINSELKRIVEVVSASEKAYCRKHGMNFAPPVSFFFTDAPSLGAYQRTDLTKFSRFMAKVPERLLPPNGRFAEMGAGFGGIAFTANLYPFAKITAYEFAQNLLKGAIGNRRALGAYYRNVRFIRADFLKIDPQRFDIIFMFRPFAENFPARARTYLANAKKDTRIIFHGLEDSAERNFIFQGNYEVKIQPDEESFGFALYIRI